MNEAISPSTRQGADRLPTPTSVGRYLLAIDSGDFDDAVEAVYSATARSKSPVEDRLRGFCRRLAEQCLRTMRSWYSRDGIPVEAALEAILSRVQAEFPRSQAAQLAIEYLILIGGGAQRKAEELLSEYDADELGEVMLSMATLCLEHAYAIRQESGRSLSAIISQRPPKSSTIHRSAIWFLDQQALSRRIVQLEAQVREIISNLTQLADPQKAKQTRKGAVRKPAASRGRAASSPSASSRNSRAPRTTKRKRPKKTSRVFAANSPGSRE